MLFKLNGETIIYIFIFFGFQMLIVKNHLIKYLVLVLFPRYPNKKLYRIYLKQLPNNQDDSTFEKKKKQWETY